MTAVLAALLAVAFTAAGAAKLAAVPAMLARAEHAGFSVQAYRRIGVLEILGAVGVIVGLVVPWIGAAAGLGLVALLVGAVITHARIGDGPKDLAPAVVLGAVAAAFTLLVIGRLL